MDNGKQWSPNGHDAFFKKYHQLCERSNRIYESRLARAKAHCKAAGLDPQLLGIHPHNAQVSADHGQPWPGIDYALVKKCLHELKHLFDARNVTTEWYRKNFNNYCFK